MDLDDSSGTVADTAATGSRRVFLHVGSPKTGTTFLQQVLWSQRDLAKDQGLLLPLGSFHDHYLASIDVRELSYEPRYPARSIGIWTDLVEEGQTWPGNVLVSHELLAGATAEQAVAAVAAWGDTDVHVIVTARDLVRQIPAEWQEHIKHRSAMTFTEFADELRERGPQSKWFWTVQDYADVCARWSAAVPPSRVHVVTVPRRGAPPTTLWQRFAGLLGLDAAAFDLSVSKTNRSLRAEQVELLRRLNKQLDDRLPLPGTYPETVKEILAQEVLAGRSGTRVALVGAHRAFAIKRSAAIVDQLRQLGVDVVGDLAELVPAETAAEPSADGARGPTEHPECMPDSTLLNESVAALTGVLERLSVERARLHEGARAMAELEAAHGHAAARLESLEVAHEVLRAEHKKVTGELQAHPLRSALISMTERHPALHRVRVGYWRAVGLARRLAGPVRRLRQP